MNVPLNPHEEHKSSGGAKPGYNVDGVSTGGNIGADFAKKLYLDQSAHPFACFFTFAIKAAAIVTYLFFSWIMGDYVDGLISTLVLQAIDFWVVKNITGRILMGLRWWCIIHEDGNEEWIYESRETEQSANKVDKYFFWGSMIVGVLFWGLFGFLNILSMRLKWAAINLACIAMIGTNLYGFSKCSTEYQKKMKKLKKVLGNKTAQDGLKTVLNKALK